jgi:beta-N-acetylhexosaminidase
VMLTNSSLRLRAFLTALLVTSVALALYLALAGSGKALASASASAASPRERQWIQQTISGMTLPQKVGQLFEVNGYGSSLRDTDPQMVALNQAYYGVNNIAQLIKKYHPGGIIYFNWNNNIPSSSNPNLGQVAQLSNGIQRVALKSGSGLPMVISVDQEGGEVIRMASPAAVFPGNMPLGATRDAALSYAAARDMGRELRAVGINVDNAPVVDVNVQPLNQADGIRAYGDRVGLVSNLGATQVTGFQVDQRTAGVGATAKHWPGFGAATENSDFSVATSPQTFPEFMKTNVPPFKAAMQVGVDRIMVTHLLYPNVTGNAITSLSRFWVNGVLRGTLGYKGPVVTDALDAAALRNLTPEQIALKALRAGDDELIEVAQCSAKPPCTPGPADKSVPGRDPAPADLTRAYPAVLNAVASGQISMRRLNQSIARILDLKWKLGLIRNPFVDPGNVPNVVGTPQHLADAQQVADRSVTLIKNDAGVLPLAKNTGKKVLITGTGQVATTTIGADVGTRGLTSEVFTTDFGTPTDAQIATAVTKANQDDLVIVTTFNVWDPHFAGQQIKLVNQLIATGKPVIVAAIGTPYDIAYVPNASTFITNYGFSLAPPSHALVKVLFGEMQPHGRLPVTITEPAPSTTVLYPFGFHLQFP